MMYDQRNFGPDYLGIGPWNTGTTWFNYQFQNHPSFTRLPFKELHYLDGINQALPLKPNNGYWKRRALIHKRRRSPFQRELWHCMCNVPFEQFFFYDFQEIRRNPQQLLKKACDFLNVPYVKNHEVENQILNSSSSVHNITREIKKKLANKHYKHIEEFIEADYLPNGEPIFREWLESLKNTIQNNEA